MIAWLQPAALWGLALIAAPLLIHLLRTRRAPTVAFPTIRFVRPSPVAAIRVGPPSDLWLLLIRAGIIALAALALAQPLAVTQARLDAWNSRVARAIVIDRSESMDTRIGSGRTAREEAVDVASAESASAAAAFRIETSDLRDGLRRAVRWLEAAPPARREAVLVSDFQLAALDDADVRALPQGIGLRLVTVDGGDGSAKQIAGAWLLEAPGIDARNQTMRISPDGTEATVSAGASERQAGLRILAGTGEEGPLMRAVARAGAPAPSADRPMVLRFANAPGAGSVAPLRERWMIDSIAVLEANPEVVRLSRDVAAIKLQPSDAWTVLARDREGVPLVRAAALQQELVVDVAVPASSYFAAVVLQSTLVAGHGSAGNAEQEVLHIDGRRLAGWNRAPAPVNAEVWRYAAKSDARWCWLGVVALLGLEQFVRRRRSVLEQEHRAAA